jgi:hypothetical protein
LSNFLNYNIAACVIKMGLNDFMANWPTMLSSLKQKINDLRSKDFKGEYESKRPSKKEPAKPTTVRQTILGDSLLEDEDLELIDLITCSQRSLKGLNLKDFLDDEAKEADGEDEYENYDESEECDPEQQDGTADEAEEPTE